METSGRMSIKLDFDLHLTGSVLPGKIQIFRMQLWQFCFGKTRIEPWAFTFLKKCTGWLWCQPELRRKTVMKGQKYFITMVLFVKCSLMHEQLHGEASVGFMFTPPFLFLTPSGVDRSEFLKQWIKDPGKWNQCSDWRVTVGTPMHKWNQGTVGVSLLRRDSYDLEPTTEIANRK